MAEKLFEPEDFLDTLDRMIEINEIILSTADPEDEPEVILDLERLRDLHHRIRLQFGIDSVVWH